MNDIKEKISAFYDGELNLSSEEIDELIIFINENPILLEQISMMALTSAIKDNEDSNLISINQIKRIRIFLIKISGCLIQLQQQQQFY